MDSQKSPTQPTPQPTPQAMPTQPIQTPPGQPTQPINPQPKSSKKLPIILVMVLVVLIVGGAVFEGFMHTPQNHSLLPIPTITETVHSTPPPLPSPTSIPSPTTTSTTFQGGGVQVFGTYRIAIP